MKKKPILKLPVWRTPLATDVVALDTEWAPDRSLLTVGLADTETAVAADKELMKPLDPSTLKEARYIGGHNVPGDIDYLVALGQCKPEWADGRKVLDSYILAKLVNENLGSKKVNGVGPYNLRRLMQRVYDIENWKAETERFDPKDATTWPPDVRAKRCAIDAWAAAKLIERLAPKVPKPVREYAHRLIMALHRIYLTGVTVDLKMMDRLGEEWRQEAAKHRELLMRAAARYGMREFSPTKDNDLRRLLFRKLKLPVTRRTKKTKLPAVDKVTLGQFKDNEVVQHLLTFNKADKLMSSWYGSDNPKSKAVPLVKLIERPGPRQDAGWLRAVLNPYAARTGRRSSGGETDRGEQAGKNMQNWPPAARPMVVSRFPKGQILSVDYSKLEVVLFAWLAKDEKLFDYFYNGTGYIGIAAELFGKTVEKDTPLYNVAKSTLLAVHYNAKAYRLAEMLWYRLGVKLAKKFHAHVEKTEEIRKKYIRAFPGVRRYIKARKQELIETGQVVIVPGHVRHLPGYANAPTKWARKHLHNEAVNAPVQGLASYVTGSAILDVESALCKANGVTLLQHYDNLLRGAVDYSVLINEVHDELVTDLHPANWKRDVELIETTMQAPPTLRALVPSLDFKLKLESKWGPTWTK